jgi:hypothetical protein
VIARQTPAPSQYRWVDGITYLWCNWFLDDAPLEERRTQAVGDDQGRAAAIEHVARALLRGEIRGGRFVAGFSGEQYALPEAIGLLRETRRRPPSEQWISLSGADPLNLIGVLTPGPRLAALTDNRLIYRDGIPVATLSAGKVQFVIAMDTKSQWEAEKRLVRSTARGLLSHLS